ncbi:MAG: DNA/RNA endonuclease [Odoribacter sp.]|nr:DNA/RNA endonuclease [Odoribacter sp.]
MKHKNLIIAAVVILSAVLLWFIIKKYAPSLTAGLVNPPELVLRITDVSEGYPDDNMDDTLLRYTGFTISYNEDNEQPAWVAYILTKTEVQSRNAERSENFRSDKNISTGSATLKDYSGSGYDRGHMAPAADMKWSPMAMSESFLLSNMSPQEQGFNRGIWSRLETKVRDWAVMNDSILVITGPVLKGINKYIGENRVGVPDYYFKVIADISAPSYKVIAFLLENRSSTGDIMNYAVTIDSVERFTGYDFFPAMQDKEMKDRMGKNIYIRLWK